MINQNFLKTLNVLYVEDDKIVREQFCKILHKLFNKVVIANNGKEGFDRFISSRKTSFEINVVISDIKMPEMGGLELLENIREISTDIPFIITTAHTDTDLLLQAIEFKASDYLVKPVDTKNLITVVQNVCQDKYHEQLKKQTLKDLEQLTNAINEVAVVIRTNLQGKITFANKMFCSVSGYKKSEIKGIFYNKLKHPNMDESVFSELWIEIQKGNIWEGIIQNICKDGKSYYLHANIIPLYDENDIDIIEFMWICFLTTQEEEEKNEFKKKVVSNVKETRRINLEAREKIDELKIQLTKYKHFDMVEFALESEQKRTSKFKSQIRYYKKEVKSGESKLDNMSSEIHQRISKATTLANEQKVKKDIAVRDFDKFSTELKAREEDVKVLNDEITKQIKLIEELKDSIDLKEGQLGLDDLQ